MMKLDRETLNEMVKLKFGARKAGGPEIDLVKLVADADYADEVFGMVENLPDETLVLLGMVLRSKFGLLTAARPMIPVAQSSARAPETADVEPAQRYLNGARS
ncbi:MAG: hypothetical protein ACYC4K_09845 [Thiobacillus sp.]